MVLVLRLYFQSLESGSNEAHMVFFSVWFERLKAESLGLCLETNPSSLHLTKTQDLEQSVPLAAWRWSNAYFALWANQERTKFELYKTQVPVAVLGKNIWGAWPLIIWEATTAKRNYYRSN